MDQIYKLQPHRTMHLQGFDDYGAAAALSGASDTGFTVSGVFRDLADFAVLVLFQKDDPFGHPLFCIFRTATSPVSCSTSISPGTSAGRSSLGIAQECVDRLEHARLFHQRRRPQ